MNPSSYLYLAAAALMSLATAYADPAVLIRENFSSYEEGSRPSQPDDGNPFPWTFSSNLKAAVKDGPTPPDASEGAKVLSIVNTDSQLNTDWKRLFEPGNSEQPLTSLTFRFKLRCNTFENSKYFLYLTNKDQPGFGPLLIFNQNGYLGIGHAQDRPGGAMKHDTRPLRTPLVVGDWYQYELGINLDQQTFSVSVNNLDQPSQRGEVTNLFFGGDITELNVFNLRPMNDPKKKSSVIDWEITDIEITH